MLSHSIKRPMLSGIALLIIGSLLAVALPATSSAASSTSPTGQTSVVRDCNWATKNARFAAIRVKKVRKRVINGQLPGWKLQVALRTYKKTLRFKNRVCASGGGSTAPLALTATEVANRVFERAHLYCDQDPVYCWRYGSYDTDTCASKSTYTWTCYGYNDETYGERCTFREVVSRTGYNGITSYQDLTYDGGGDGWICA